jgi:hypothetical protein
LSLCWCPGLTDDSVKALAGLADLEELDLSFCGNLTEAGLLEILQLRWLRSLNLCGCIQLTDKAVEGLRAALPGCAITGPR